VSTSGFRIESSMVSKKKAIKKTNKLINSFNFIKKAIKNCSLKKKHKKYEVPNVST